MLTWIRSLFAPRQPIAPTAAVLIEDERQSVERTLLRGALLREALWERCARRLQSEAIRLVLERTAQQQRADDAVVRAERLGERLQLEERVTRALQRKLDALQVECDQLRELLEEHAGCGVVMVTREDARLLQVTAGGRA